MANTTWFDDFWLALKLAITQAWPEIGRQVFVDTRLARENWVNDINNKKIVGAWCAVKLDYTPTSEWGIGSPRYQLVATISYIAPIPTGPQTETMAATLTNKLIALQAAIRAGAGLGTVLVEMPMQTNTENPVNESMLENKLDYQAATLSPTFILATY